MPFCAPPPPWPAGSGQEAFQAPVRRAKAPLLAAWGSLGILLRRFLLWRFKASVIEVPCIGFKGEDRRGALAGEVFSLLLCVQNTSVITYRSDSRHSCVLFSENSTYHKTRVSSRTW